MRQRLVQPPRRAAPAALEPGQRAIGVAQAAQGGGDAHDRGVDRGVGFLARFLQHGGGPCQQGEDVEQFLGVAGDDAARGVDLMRAFRGQRAQGGGQVMLHPGQGAGGIDQAGQRLEPGQPVRGGPPAPREKGGLAAQGGEEGAGFRGALPAHQEQRVADPADLRPATPPTG